MLKELYSDMQNSNISILLGRSVNSIANKASRLGLNKSKLHLHKIAAMPNKGKYKSYITRYIIYIFYWMLILQLWKQFSEHA